MQRSTLSIVQTMVPSQRATEQSIPAPREFGPDNWRFSTGRAPLDWQPGVAALNCDNYFTSREGWQSVRTGALNPLTGEEPIYGHVNYLPPPIDVTWRAPYALQQITRVADNMSPAGVMRNPTFEYPVPAWQNVYNGSRRPNAPMPFATRGLRLR